MYNKNQASNKHQLMYGKNYNKLPPDTERHRPPKSSNKSCHQSTNLGLFIDNTRKNTIKNDLHAMKRILYDTGHLRVARWLLQRGLKFQSPILP